MAQTKEKMGNAGVIITCTLDALAATTVTTGRQSTVVDNTVDLFIDALVQANIVSGASGVSTTGTVEFYAYASVDDAASFSDVCTGADGAVTLTNPPNLPRLGIMNIVASATTYRSRPMSVAAAFGGILPARWGIVALNKTGASFGTGCSLFFQGISFQTA